MNSEKESAAPLSNPPVHIKMKLASLWTALMFLYIYADYFRLMTPGKLEKMMQLKTPMGPTTPELLMIFSGILIVPALMIFLSVFLKPGLNKWLNIIIGCLYALISVLIIKSSIGNAWQTFFVVFNVIELIVLILIIALAWKWPKA